MTAGPARAHTDDRAMVEETALPQGPCFVFAVSAVKSRPSRLKVAADEPQGLFVPHAGQTSVHCLSPAHRHAGERRSAYGVRVQGPQDSADSHASAFDVPPADGRELLHEPYTERRAAPAGLLARRGPQVPWTLCPDSGACGAAGVFPPRRPRAARLTDDGRIIVDGRGSRTGGPGLPPRPATKRTGRRDGPLPAASVLRAVLGKGPPERAPLPPPATLEANLSTVRQDHDTATAQARSGRARGAPHE
ncbi:hypothetical protein C1I97_13435 [Streptomyces sp. NTH33]|nr:hypothetical protein C1I97_13435 [Streptomyces sp. NTH33]